MVATTPAQIAAIVNNYTPEQQEISLALLTCGIIEERDRALFISGEGFNTLLDFGLLTSTSISDMVKRLGRRTIAQDQVKIKTMTELRLKVLCYWARRHEEFQPVGTPILAANFTQNTIMDLQREMLAEDRVDGAEQTALDPGKIDCDDWNSSKTKVLLYFDACLGVDKVPLTYVLRESDVVTAPEGSREWKIQSAHRAGTKYEQDNARIYRYLKKFVIGTNAEEVIGATPNGDGHLAWTTLVDYFEGQGNRARLIANARDKLEKVHWESEYTRFPAAQVVNVMKEQYRLLAAAGIPTDDYTKVELLLSKFRKTSNPTVVTIILQHIGSTLMANFDAACNYLIKEIGAAFPNAGPRRSKRNISSVSNPDDSPAKGQHQKVYRGVDIQDEWREFSAEEKKKLGPEGLHIVRIKQQESSGNDGSRGGGRGGGYRGGRGGRGRGRGGRGRGRDGRGRGGGRGWEARISAIESKLGAATTPAADDTPSDTGDKGAKNGSKFGQKS